MSPTLFGRACRPYPIIAYIRPRLPPYRALILTVPAALCRWYTNSIDSSVHLTQHSYRGIVINHTLILIHRACCPVSSWQVGIITPTDMLNEMEMEATDDVMRFSGSGGGASSRLHYLSHRPPLLVLSCRVIDSQAATSLPRCGN